MKLSGLARVGAILLFSVSFLTITSCDKSNSTTQSGAPGVNMQRPIEIEKNYCKGCGSAYDEHFYCSHRSCMDDGGCPKDCTDDLDNQRTAAVKQQEKIDMYDLRDNYLINSEKGQWYISYYYELGAIAVDNNLINASTFSDYANFGADLLAAANLIRFGTGTEIPIDNTLYNTAMGFVQTFRLNTTDAVILGYLDIIEADLNDIVNKDVNYIRTLL